MSDKNQPMTGLPSGTWGRRAVLITAVAGLLLSLGAFGLSWHSETMQIRTVLDFRADWRAKDMEGKLARLGTFLSGMTAFVATSPGLSSEDFQNFVKVRQSFASLPDHSAVYWEFVTDDKRAAYEERMRRETGNPSFTITERVPGTNTVTLSQKRDFYLPMTRRVTQTKNPLFPMGYDVWSDPSRRAALENAWHSGKIVSSAPFTSPSWPTDSLALQLLSPVYKNGVPPENADERTQSLTGIVAVTYSLKELLEYIIADTPQITEDIYVSMKKPDPAQTENSIAQFKRDEQHFIVTPGQYRIDDLRGMAFEKQMDFRGVPWFLVFHFCQNEVSALRTFEPWLFLIIGLFVTTGAAYYVEIMRRKREQMHLALAVGETQLRATASELAVSNVRLAALVSSSPAAIICLDPEGKVTLWNPAAEEMLGFTSAEMMGKPYTITPHDVLKPLRPGKNHITKEATQTDKNDRKVHVTFTSAPFYDETGTQIGSIYVMSDITERLSLERQLRQAQKMEAVGQLTGGIAHDFNNLLGILIGNLDLMEGRIDASGEQLRQSSIEAVLRGSSLTKSLLAFSRQQSLSPTIVDINQHLSTTVDMLSRLLGEQIEIQLKTEPALWAVHIDPVQMESAITNLAINARDAMTRNGRLIICTCNRTLDEDYVRHNPEVIPGEYACIEVSDTGSGMPQDVLARVFEPFFSTKATGKGTGLGLSMVYGFIKQSGGHIKIYSEIGHGTTIRLYLPRYKKGYEKLEVAPIAVPTAFGGGETIFVVEDNASMRQTAVQQLQSLGYKTIEAASGEDAWKMIQKGLKFNLLFSDVVMPGNLSGFDLAKLACEFDPNTRILLTSGFPGLLTAEQRQAEAGCGIELLSKPYRKNDLATKIREALDKKL